MLDAETLLEKSRSKYEALSQEWESSLLSNNNSDYTSLGRSLTIGRKSGLGLFKQKMTSNVRCI